VAGKILKFVEDYKKMGVFMISYALHWIRHGMTQGNLSGRYVGQQDLPVCSEGFAQMRRMAERFSYPQVSAVYLSPMLRCRQTADFLYPQTPGKVVEEIAEMSFGDFEGKLISEVKELPAFKLWLADARHNAPPGGEDGELFFNRVSAGLQAIFTDMMRNGSTQAAVVTHGGVMMTLLSAFGYPRRPMTAWPAGNLAGYTVRTSAQMWMRDRAFEIIGTLPEGFEVEAAQPVPR
jgi:alpha-ribazole phosphatase